MDLMYLRKNPSETIFIMYLFIIGLIGLPYLEIGRIFSSDPLIAEMKGLIICRSAGIVLMLLAMRGLGLEGALFPRGKVLARLVVMLPALAVAVNNLPIHPLVSGRAFLEAPADTVCLFELECLCVGLFEELSFRGILFPLFLQSYGTRIDERLYAAINCSLLFGMLHFVNLLSGASFPAVLLQAGYSFLIGCMFSVLIFGGCSVLTCACLHGLYNFCGLVIPTLGRGDSWDLITYFVTILIGGAVFVLLAMRMVRAEGATAKELAAFSESGERVRARKRVN